MEQGGESPFKTMTPSSFTRLEEGALPIGIRPGVPVTGRALELSRLYEIRDYLTTTLHAVRDLIDELEDADEGH